MSRFTIQFCRFFIQYVDDLCLAQNKTKKGKPKQIVSRSIKGKIYYYLRVRDKKGYKDSAISNKDAMKVLEERLVFKQASNDLTFIHPIFLSAYEKSCKLLAAEYELCKKCYSGLPKQKNTDWYPEGLVMTTARGEKVRSKSEVIIANTLHLLQIDYIYELPLTIEDGQKTVCPDFTIPISIQGRPVFWEHCGLISQEDYARDWFIKRAAYATAGIIEGRNLIVTYDVADGQIDSMEIESIARTWFLPPKSLEEQTKLNHKVKKLFPPK